MRRPLDVAFMVLDGVAYGMLIGLVALAVLVAVLGWRVQLQACEARARAAASAASRPQSRATPVTCRIPPGSPTPSLRSQNH